MLKFNLFALFFFLSFESAFAVKIAVIMKLNDSYGKYPQDMFKAMKYSLEKSDLKEMVKLVPFSHDGGFASIQKSVIAAKKFDPDIVIGGETSQFAMTISRAFKDKIFITPTASSHKINEVHPKAIRMIHSDDQYVSIVQELDSKITLGKVGVFHNTSYPNTDRIAIKVREYLVSKKIDFTVVEAMNGGEINSETLKPFLKRKLDTLIVFSYDSDLQKIVSTLSKNGSYPLYVGADGWGRDSFLKENLLNKNLKFRGIRAIYWNSNRQDAEFKKTISSMELYLGKKVDAFHAIGYDTMKIILNALKINPRIADLQRTIRSNVFREVLTSEKITFNSNYEPIKDLYLYKLDHLGIHFYKKVIPK